MRLPAGAALIATDLSGAMIAHARQRLPESPDLTWREADACQLPFMAGEFDLAVCQFGLMFVPDKPGAIREMRRVLEAGGLGALPRAMQVIASTGNPR